MARRLAHASWVLGYLDDIESDLSAVHGLDMWSLTSERFFKLADRLIHYQGAVRDMVLARRGSESPGRAAPRPEIAAGHAAAEVDTDAPVRELRRAARLRRYPVEKFGDHREVPLEDALRGSGG